MKTLDEVITAFEKADARWSNDPHNPIEYSDFCDALIYLKEFRDLLKKSRSERLVDILREVRGEKYVE